MMRTQLKCVYIVLCLSGGKRKCFFENCTEELKELHRIGLSVSLWHSSTLYLFQTMKFS